MAQARSVLKSVETARSSTGKPYVKIEFADGLKFNVWKDGSELLEARGRTVDYEFEKNSRGYNELLRWAYAPDTTSASSDTSSQTSSGGQTDRQESIERQSAFSRAVELNSSLLAAGMFSAEVTKAIKKDPSIFFDIVASTATKIKEFVQTGDWAYEELASGRSQESGALDEDPNE